MDPIIVRKPGGKLLKMIGTNLEDEHVQLSKFNYETSLRIFVLRGEFGATTANYDFAVISPRDPGLFAKWVPRLVLYYYGTSNYDYVLSNVPDDISRDITFQCSYILNLRGKIATKYKLTERNVCIIKDPCRHHHICHKCKKALTVSNKKVQFYYYCCSNCVNPMVPNQAVYHGKVCEKDGQWYLMSRAPYGTINNSEDYFRGHPIVLYLEINNKNI